MAADVRRPPSVLEGVSAMPSSSSTPGEFSANETRWYWPTAKIEVEHLLGRVVLARASPTSRRRCSCRRGARRRRAGSQPRSLHVAPTPGRSGPALTRSISSSRDVAAPRDHVRAGRTRSASDSARRRAGSAARGRAASACSSTARAPANTIHRFSSGGWWASVPKMLSVEPSGAVEPALGVELERPRGRDR